jgi:predicted acyl esterase
VAALRPPHLKAIFAPYGWSDGYRDLYYRGGILAHGFLVHWILTYGPDCRVQNSLRDAWGDEKYEAGLNEALADPEITAYPVYKQALEDPDHGLHPLFCEILLNKFIGPYYEARAVDFTAASSVPLYAGGDWKGYAFHLSGDIRAFENWRGPKKLTIGPGIYLDRPLYQYAFEQLRWFDHWLKGIDTGLMDEAPVQLFIQGTGEWKQARDWPVPGTRWTPFYLHAGGLLSEHEHWPNEGFTTFEDSPFHHAMVEFRTPPMVEETEVCGPVVLNLHGSTTDTEVLWFATLFHVDAEGTEETLTRGWLRGSQRKLDEDASRPFQPVHAHTGRQPLTPNEIYEFNIEVRPYGILLKAGERIGVRIKCADDEPPRIFIESIAQGQISRPRASHVTIHHNAEHPSHLLLPVTKGNRIGTFISGGALPPLVAP